MECCTTSQLGARTLKALSLGKSGLGVLPSPLFEDLRYCFRLCTPAHITGMLLPKFRPRLLFGTTYPFPPINLKYDRSKGIFSGLFQPLLSD